MNKLPKLTQIQSLNIETNFVSEEVLVRKLDYYYTNSISRASKTMSECRLIHKKIKKNGTNN